MEITKYIIGINIAGSIFPIFIFFNSKRLMPIPIIKTPPTADISVIAGSVKKPFPILNSQLFFPIPNSLA